MNIMKRQLDSETQSIRKRRRIDCIDESLIENFDKNFDDDKSNSVAMNSVVNVGPLMASTDPNEKNKITYIFLNTLKKKTTKATDQGNSGRCWIFSGLNMLRHSVISALNLEDFEFSETYLYFWDKLERSNTYIQWFIDNLYNKYDVDDRYSCHMLKEYMTDGGYWNYFADLVEKYGLIPKSTMGETENSSYSGDMNDIIMDRLHACTVRISNVKKNNGTIDQLNAIKNRTLQQIYNVLVKCLGKPPKNFVWSFATTEETSAAINDLTPQKFKELILPNFSMKDFVVLGHVPIKGCTLRKKYAIENSNNLENGSLCEFINVTAKDMKKYAKKSISSGFPVWFASDVRKGFHPLYASLNDKVINTTATFGTPYKTTKGERLLFRNQEGNHAMVLVGFNSDENDNTVSWQVENSWGYYDHEVPGLDGFMCMDDKWFDEYVMQIVVHKNYLSKSLQELTLTEPCLVKPWDGLAPAIRINPIKPRQDFLRKTVKKSN